MSKKSPKPATGRTPRTPKPAPAKRQGAERDDWQAPFLTALRDAPNVRAAAEAANVARSTVYLERERDPLFASLMDDALEDGCDLVEAALFKRAVHGVTSDVFYQGEPCGTKTEYSDTAAIAILRAHRKAKWGNQVDVTSGGEQVNVCVYIPDNGRDARD